MTPIEQSLAHLRRELEAFLALLEEEGKVLGVGNADLLTGLTEQRRTQSLRIADLWKRLAGQLGTLPQAGFEALRDKALAGKPATPAWQTVEGLVREAARLNQANGRLIEEQMRRNQAAMQVLRNAASSRTLYGADGRMSDFSNLNRSIDSA
ncbi:MAG: flagellar protein FlgN [Pseudomonadota bacterium]